MLEFQNAGTIYSTIMMQEPQPKAVLLVEGSSDDSLLDAHLADEILGLVCGARATVIESAKIAWIAGRRNVLGLVDRDIQPEVGGDIDLPKTIVATSTYDLTADVAQAKPGAIGRVANALAHREARTVQDARGEDIEAAVLDLASRLAGVRVAVSRDGFPIRMKGFNFKNVIAEDFSTKDEIAFLDSLMITEAGYTLSSDARAKISLSISETKGARHLCGGHDIGGAMFGLLSKAGAKQVSTSFVEAAIRAFADCALLSSLKCIDALQNQCAELVGVPMFGCFEEKAKAEDSSVCSQAHTSPILPRSRRSHDSLA